MDEKALFHIGDLPIFSTDLIALVIVFILFGLFFLAITRFVLPLILRKREISPARIKKGKVLFFLFMLLLFLDIAFRIFDVNIIILKNLSLSLLVEAGILLVLSYVILWIASNLFIHTFFQNQDQQIRKEKQLFGPKKEERIISTLKWFLFCLAFLILLRYINWDLTIWTFKSPKENAPDILVRLSSLVMTLIIYLMTRIVVWFGTNILIYPYYKKQQFDTGIIYSINKLISYLAYFIATIVALRNLGMDMGLLLGGAAALLVGVGLALQSTFADFFAGLVLLFERPIKVGDFISFDNKTVKVQKIGLRASKVKTRESINFIIPNSKMIMHPVVNWSHDEKAVRFTVSVGVAYGSDTKLVEELLLNAAIEHKDVLKRPAPKVIFSDFADSSLLFNLNYYSSNIFNAEWVKSDLRFKIDELFRLNKISIPFPQRDVWMKS